MNYQRNVQRFLAASVLLGMMAASNGMMSAVAQEDEAAEETEDSDAVKALKSELELAKLRKEIAESERDEFKADIERVQALSDTEGAEGTVTFKDDGGYFAELLSYDALDDITRQIATDISGTVDKQTVVLVDADNYALRGATWNLLRKRIDMVLDAAQTLENRYDNNGIDHVPGSGESIVAIAAIPAFLGAAADIAAFFKTDREITGREVQLSTDALRANLANSLLTASDKRPSEILLPGLGYDSSGGALSADLDRLATKIGTLKDTRRNLKKTYQDAIQEVALDVELSTAKIESLVGRIKKKIEAGLDTSELDEELAQRRLALANLKQIEREWNDVKTTLDAVIQEAEQVFETATAIDKDGNSPMLMASLIDVVESRPRDSIVLLHVSIVSQGAEIEVAKSMWSQGKVNYLGGAAVSYILVKRDGSYLKSGTVSDFATDSFKRSQGAGSLSLAD